MAAEIRWIKITTDIFSDEKIRLIEQMPEGDTLIVIWFKLLCMAGKSNNNGIFVMANNIPYTEEMLSTVFARPLNTVRLAISTFEAFGMIDIIDDIITLVNWDKHQNIEGMEKIREQNRIRKQRERERKKELLLEEKCHVTSRDCHATEKEEEKEKEKKNKKKNNTYFDDASVNAAFLDYMEMRKKIKAPMTDRAITLAVNKVHELAKGDAEKQKAIIEQSVMNSWKGLFPLKEEKNKKNKFHNLEEHGTDYEALIGSFGDFT